MPGFVEGVCSGMAPVETTPNDFNTDGSMQVMLAPVSTSPVKFMGVGTGSPALRKASARGLLIPQTKSSIGPVGVMGSVKWGTEMLNRGLRIEPLQWPGFL